MCAMSSLTTASTTTFPDAEASDPAKLGWMIGSPPPPDRTVRFEDGSYFQFPAMRWSVSNFRQLMPTINVSIVDLSFVAKKDIPAGVSGSNIANSSPPTRPGSAETSWRIFFQSR
jgi:hypothetical protein